MKKRNAITNPGHLDPLKDQESQTIVASPTSPARRKFLGNVSGAAAATLAAGVVGVPALGSSAAANAKVLKTTAVAPLLDGASRAAQAYDIRVQAATIQKIAPQPDHPNNGDEDRYLTRIGNYSKGLPHNSFGEVDQVAYNAFMQAVASGAADDFERIPMGDNQVRLTNPQAGLTFEMTGPDPAHMYMPPAPAFSSAELAGEIAENYWMALTRDVSFLDYDSNSLTNAAAADLSRFSDFRGPRFHPRFALPLRGQSNLESQTAVSELEAGGSEIEQQDQLRVPVRQQISGPVTPATLFRGNTPGDLVGPYISQFLWKNFFYGAQPVSQKMRVPIPGDDYLTNYSDWLFTQSARGHAGLPSNYDQTLRYIRNGRDLAEWVHIDLLFQAYLSSTLVLLGIGAPTDPNNPYRKYRNQGGFGTFGPPHIQALVTGIATNALRAVWYQKWFVHRRLRPEAFAGRIHNHLTKATTYPLHADILKSAAVQEVDRKFGSYLLPMAFPEGCPTHPAYGAGHATVAGACVTVLKWWFDESWVIPDPVVPTPDGLSLVPYRGENLTVGNELNKVAANIAFGRNIGGVHWRSDAWESMKFGEAVAISVLQDQKNCWNERFEGLSLTKFDGTRIRV
ncbi:MAG: vanadium-dependent haloperoxidase [Acidobacteriota bacterium]|nr:vanadium-dependent haloperoxidase [Acidobacteriota bacterium]